jgi:hypothetical protein
MAEHLDEIAVDRQSGAVADLLPVDTQRWSPRRKAAVVNAVRDGRISLEGQSERRATPISLTIIPRPGSD